MPHYFKWLFSSTLILCLSGIVHAEPSFLGKKIMYIDSYHPEMVWVKGITAGINEVLADTEVEFKTVHLDTKHKSNEAQIRQAAQAAKSDIDSFQPDVVITSDDNAVKYVLQPYYKNTDLPFVFCGLNAKPETYGLPYRNATGMLEISLANQVVRLLKNYVQGDKVGLLGVNRFSQREVARYHQETLNITYEKIYLVETFAQWQEKYQQLQTEVDLLILLINDGITGWDDQKAKEFMKQHTKIPSGTEQYSMTPFSMIGITIVPEEHGRWAANTALKILEGMSPAALPMTKNKGGKLIINLSIANQLGILFDMELLKMAEVIQ